MTKVFFSQVIHAPDPPGLLGQTRSEKDLRAEKAELYFSSLACPDTASAVEPGVIGEKKELDDRLSDTDLPAWFLLDSLI